MASCFTRILLFLFIVSSISPQVRAACNSVDEKALLAFKNGDSDRTTILSDWGKAGTSCCSWSGITCDAAGRVTGITLNSLGLRGQLPPELGTLSELSTLNLFDNAMDGSIPSEFGSLQKLQTLNLGGNFFSGVLPSSLSKLASTLRVLDLSRYRFGDITPVIGKLVNLQTLVLDSSTTTSAGSIPSFLGNLKALRRLSLATITSFTGSIPSTFSQLLQLQELDLNFCLGLSGSIPQFLSTLHELKHLDLSDTKISGSIPPSLGKLSKLTFLALSNTLLSGSIPTTIGQLTSLTTLKISGTRVSGGIPSEIGSLKALKLMDLSKNAGMGGSIPESIGNLEQLEDLDLSGSGLTGAIPSSIGRLTKLVNLRMSENSLSGSIPESMGLLSNLDILVAFTNRLSGQIPEGFSRALTNLSALQLSNNFITGLPRSMVNLRRLSSVDLGNNSLSFDTITGLATIPHLSSLSLSKCKLQGPVPSWLRNIKMEPDSGSSMRLDLSENMITGEVPAEFGKLTGLTSLSLQSNRFVGKLPDSFDRLGKLTFSDFSSNLITGVPADLSNLGRNVLYSFGLDNNTLSFEELKGLTTLSQVSFMTLSGSRLKGPIPSWVLSIRIVQDDSDAAAVLDLSSNSISGEIPGDIDRLSQLTQLSLNDNQLTGPIPPSIGNITSLRFLHLEKNKLTGGIPSELLKLRRLRFFSVANNKLQGQIPSGAPLSTQDASAYAGNPGLCGTPLPPC